LFRILIFGFRILTNLFENYYLELVSFNKPYLLPKTFNVQLKNPERPGVSETNRRGAEGLLPTTYNLLFTNP